MRDTDRGVRPDYAISVAGAITGHIEVKKPGANLGPASFTGHNLRQWERQRNLPNLISTNGTEWRIYQDSEPHRDPVHLHGAHSRPPAETSRHLPNARDASNYPLTAAQRLRGRPVHPPQAAVRSVEESC